MVDPLPALIERLGLMDFDAALRMRPSSAARRRSGRARRAHASGPGSASFDEVLAQQISLRRAPMPRAAGATAPRLEASGTSPGRC